MENPFILEVRISMVVWDDVFFSVCKTTKQCNGEIDFDESD